MDINYQHFHSERADNEVVFSQSVDDDPATKEPHDSPATVGRRTSWVWKHYTIFKEDGKVFSTCNHCKKKTYHAEGHQGTTNQTKHLYLCLLFKKLKASEPDNLFDQKVYCRMFAEAIMCDAYPLHVVEHVKLRDLHKYLNLNVRHITRNTILKHCTNEYVTLKAHLYKLSSELHGRICFTCDM